MPFSYNGQLVPANYFDLTVGIKLGSSPLGGVHTFLTSGLFQLARRTQKAAIRTNALTWGNLIVRNLSPTNRWYKWNLLVEETLVVGTQ